jgi:hypothetical protein
MREMLLAAGFHTPKKAGTQFDESRPLAFMHVPKTAGTSVAAALIDALRPNTTLTGFDRVLFGDYEEFSSIHDEIRRTIYFSANALPAADLFFGHAAYSTLRQRFPNGHLMTVLREPFSRILSHWLYWRSLSDDVLVPLGSWADRVRRSRLPLDQFLSHPCVACQLDNLVVRMLLWPHKLIPVDNYIDPRHDQRLLAEAHDRLAHFSFVDVVESPEFPTDCSDGWAAHLLSNGATKRDRLLRRFASLSLRN